MPCLFDYVKKYIDGRLYTRATSSLGNLPSVSLTVGEWTGSSDMTNEHSFS